ncbi:hypothetical protein BDQ12DRAFT_84187 [Crucibulum laeve]|uniref:Uncharacterized protein n=1 Tax=Crucibulum laeve TaxID=68775 RepID=A0A5C3M292_9AGAR|nr:hypothetical protein BDQ12DRAFT_84187 [Crucibulum laeve]
MLCDYSFGFTRRESYALSLERHPPVLHMLLWVVVSLLRSNARLLLRLHGSTLVSTTYIPLPRIERTSKLISYMSLPRALIKMDTSLRCSNLAATADGTQCSKTVNASLPPLQMTSKH